MTSTIVERLAAFSADASIEQLPAAVVHETKRILLDTIGCALAATNEPKGRIGVQIAGMMGGSTDATIIGTKLRSSVFGAAFANGELINALDFDPVLPPGHVSPYVIPAALALAEANGTPGHRMVTAVAVAHEMSNRLGKAMDYLRDMKDGRMATPNVYGYSSTVFGATAAAMIVKGLDAHHIAQGLGIAGSISPVNSHMSWVRHAPSSTIKYLVAGTMAQTALTAASMGELGHRGDISVLDDAEYGFPAMIGTKRWEPKPVLDRLGEHWGFVAESSFKPYPHCRVLHSVFDALIELLDRNDIQAGEIEGIDAWGEAFVELPIWQNDRIDDVVDAQFSLKHGIALAAQRVKPGKAWQDPELVFSPSVMGLMGKVRHFAHPDYVAHLAEDPASRPARVEVRARGKVFAGERLYPKGSPSRDPDSYMTDNEVVAKFLHNADGILASEDAQKAVELVLTLEKVADIVQLTALLAAKA